METFTKCYVCPANKNTACFRGLTFYLFPSGQEEFKDQLWRAKFLAALEFPQETINKPPTEIEKKRIICSRHFKDSCFTSNRHGELFLIHGSVPELLLEELRNNHVQVEVTISDEEDDDVPPQLDLDEMAFNPHPLNDDDTEEMSIPDLTVNLDRQEKRKDETPSIGSESGLILPVHSEEPHQNGRKEIGLASDLDSCASTVLYEDNRPISPPMISQNSEIVQNDRDDIIGDPDVGERENSLLNEEMMSPGTSAFFEDLIDGFSIKSFLTEEEMDDYSEHSAPNQSSEVSITNPATPRELFEKESITGSVPMDCTTTVTAGCSSPSNSPAYAIDNRNCASTREVTSTPINQAQLPPTLDWPIHSLTGVLRSVPTILPEQAEVDDNPMEVIPSGDFILDGPLQHIDGDTILARNLFLDVNALASPLYEPSGLPDSPNESQDMTLDEVEDPLAPCGKVHCTGCICDSSLTSRPPCGNLFCQDVNSCTLHARAPRHSVDSNVLEMRRGKVEERREREIEDYIRENGGLNKRQVLRELYLSKRENALLRSKLTDQPEEIRFLKDSQRPRPVESPPSSGSNISGKDGVPLSEELMDQWASTFHKNSPCDFVARLVPEMFTEDYLANAPELEEGQIQAIISATMKRYKTCYLGETKRGRPSKLTADLVKEFIASVLKEFST